jgi:ATP-binding cassette subfamily B protein
MSFPHYSQLEYSDCGPTCLKIILKYYKKKCSLEYLRELCGTSRAGVSMSDIFNAAEKLAFEAVSVLCTTEWLIGNAVLPCIIHWKQDHFVVLYKITNKFFYVSDPAYGKIRLTHEVFNNWWKESNSKGIALFLEPTDAFDSLILPRITIRQSLQKSISYYRTAAKGQRNPFLGLTAVIGLSVIILYAFPKSVELVMDQAVKLKRPSLLLSIFSFQLLLIFGQNLLSWLQSWFRVRISMNISVRMVRQLLHKLIRLPIRYFDTKVPTDLFQRIDDQRHIESFLSEQLLQTMFSLIMTVVLIVRLFLFNTSIGMLFSSMSLVSIGWVFLFYKWRWQLDYTNFRLTSENHNLVNEMIFGMVEIKINSAQNKKINQWQDLQKKIFGLKKKLLHLGVQQDIGVQLLTQLKNISITCLSAYWLMNGHLTIGAMLSIGYIVGMLSSPIDSLASFSKSAQDAQLAFSRLNEIVEREDEVRPYQHALEVPFGAPIRLMNISFRYEGSSQSYVLKDLTATIPWGKITAIVGSSGSGKSTLLKLLLNFYTPQKGSLYFGEQRFSDVNPEDWRQKCGIVMQDGYIFSGTIGDNIALGEENPDPDRLLQAVRIACLDDFITSLPMKFHTKIGNTGMGLSGGQRQRLLIARAVYSNPEFLLFDEATSSLDANNEKKIMENLTAFFRDKTVVVIAHRLSTVKNADQIIVLESGRIIESGDHINLTRLRGRYFELVRNQLDLGS